jgi:hypothetical protein
MQPGWEFKVNASGGTWYVHTGTRQVQLWRPELQDEEEDADEEEDPEIVAQREAAAAATKLLELITALKLRQADIVASITALQGKVDAQTKALKTKKGDALKTGQAQQQALEKQIKEGTQDLAAIKLEIADAQRKLPSSSKNVAQATQPHNDSSVVSKKVPSSGPSGKPIGRANTMATSKSATSASSAAKLSVAARPVPVSRSSTVTAVSSASFSSSNGSSPAAQKPPSKTVPPPLIEIKEFGHAIEKLDSKLLTISDEICLDVDDQMWAPIKRLSFYPVLEKPFNPSPASTTPADTKKSSMTSTVSTPAKTAASTTIKSSATPLSRSSSSASSSTIATPLSSARK